jgi:hypothetical protein
VQKYNSFFLWQAFFKIIFNPYFLLNLYQHFNQIALLRGAKVHTSFLSRKLFIAFFYPFFYKAGDVGVAED